MLVRLPQARALVAAVLGRLPDAAGAAGRLGIQILAAAHAPTRFDGLGQAGPGRGRRQDQGSTPAGAAWGRRRGRGGRARSTRRRGASAFGPGLAGLQGDHHGRRLFHRRGRALQGQQGQQAGVDRQAGRARRQPRPPRSPRDHRPPLRPLHARRLHRPAWLICGRAWTNCGGA